jgi:alcohol dehydrogenase
MTVPDPFEFGMRTRVAFGCGMLSRAGELAREHSAKRALIVTDPGIVRAGHMKRAEAALQQAGIATQVFSEVHENPTTHDVERGLSIAHEFSPDFLVAIGGGSSMDCAKGINFLFTNGGRMQDYWGIGKAKHPMLPAMAIPTTAGTGSEAQSFALISDPVTHQKMACGDRKVAFRVAILDPELTCSQPTRVTALTGIDAVAHAIETLVTRTRNPFSLMCSLEAWRLLAKNFSTVVQNAQDLSARAAMQLGAHWAGVAIEHSMLGAAHSLANPLTSRFGIVHGQAVSVMLPGVVRRNAQQFQPLYEEAIRFGQELGVLGAGDGIDPLCAGLQEMSRKAGLAVQLQELGIPRNRLHDLAQEAAQQWTLKFNPVPLTVDDLAALYAEAF